MGTTVNGAGSRRLQSWIDSFLDYTAPLPSPVLFRRWAGISLIGATLARKVWIRTFAVLYPNLYIMLVGGPAAGKTLPTEEASRLYRQLGEGYFIAPSSVTAASLSDSLQAAKTKLVRPTEDPPYVEYNSLYITSTEMSVFLPEYEGHMMARLTDLWDGSVPYEEKRRAKDINIVINNPQLNLLAATTPSYLNEFMPAGAWDQGFISRVILVYSGEAIRKSLFGTVRDAGLYQALISDLRSLGEVYGELLWEDGAIAAIEAWHQRPEPIPSHPRLINYNARRTAHLLKLCMIAAMERGNANMTIALDDFDRALGWLIEAEMHMPDIFKAMTSGGDSQILDETWQFVYTEFLRGNNRPVPEHLIIHFLQKRVPTHNVLRSIELMQLSNMIKAVAYDVKGRATYAPVPRTDHGAA